MWAAVCSFMFLFSSALSHEEFRARFLDDVTCGKDQLKIPDRIIPWVNCANETEEIKCGRFEIMCKITMCNETEEVITALGHYSYVGTSSNAVTGGDGSQVYMLDKAAGVGGNRTGLIHKYTTRGWIGSNVKIESSDNWDSMIVRNVEWLRSGGVENGNRNGCFEEKIDDCNTNWHVKQRSPNFKFVFNPASGLKIICHKEKFVGDSWTNVGVCVADDSEKSCGGTGQQTQTRECNDGTIEKCTNSEKEQKITCNLPNCPAIETTTDNVKPLTKAPTKAQAPTKAETTQDEATTTSTTTTKRTSTTTLPQLNPIMTITTANVTTASAETNNKEVSYLVGLILFINVFWQTMH